MDGGLKYFLALSGNKRHDVKLKTTEANIDECQKRMLSRYWKDKFDIFDEMVRLNVRTPSFKNYQIGTPDSNCEGEDMVDSNTISLGQMKLDAKLMGNKPVSLQKKRKGRTEPVISIVGNEATCYPSKDSVRGRKVELTSRVVRRIEECRLLSSNLRAMQTRMTDHKEEAKSPYPYYSLGSPPPRPITAPRPWTRSSLNSGKKRAVKSAGVRPLATPISRPLFIPRTKSATAILDSDDENSD